MMLNQGMSICYNSNANKKGCYMLNVCPDKYTKKYVKSKQNSIKFVKVYQRKETEIFCFFSRNS